MTSFANAKTLTLSGIVLATLAVSGAFVCGMEESPDHHFGMAVEFTDHATAAFVAQEMGWYEQRGIRLASYESYATGMALASALARGDIQAAYICLVPAISAYANAGVQIKIVAGTHRYGYGLVVDPQVVTRVEDLAADGVRTGCVREGGAVDVLMNRAIDRYGLDRQLILGRVRRMNPSKLLLAIQTGRLDAGFLPEHWASLAEDFGFQMLLTAQDIWPGMLGSVLVVKDELARENPDIVRALVAVNDEATEWINDHPHEAANTLARVLSLMGDTDRTARAGGLSQKPGVNEAAMLRSMDRLDYTTTISPDEVQEVIDYLARLGYIDDPFAAEEILALEAKR